MSMLTRCANCNAVFRITTEQLVSRQGKVRCGKCGVVFNALDKLVPHPATADTGADVVTAEAALAASAPASYDLFGAAPSLAGHGAGQTITSAAQGTSSLLLAAPDGRFAWWSLVGVLLAILLLAAQGAYFYRSQLSVAYPPAKPLLEAACAELGCTLATPVDLQSISIESSDLQADPGNRAVLVLSAMLRNRATFAQQLPFLELSLTDPQDTALARRVLRPAEYAPRAMPATIAAGGEFQVRMYIDAGQLKANGYRLYAFYP